ncbi:permease [Saccharopolyspora sp. NPDC000995]
MAALEARIGELSAEAQAAREDAAAARHLAAANDRGVAEIHRELRDFRQTTSASFNAHREDLADLRSNLVGLRSEVRGSSISWPPVRSRSRACLPS